MPFAGTADCSCCRPHVTGWRAACAQAQVERDEMRHHIISRPAMFQRMVGSLLGTEEITLIAMPDMLTVQSFHNSADTFTGALRALSTTLPPCAHSSCPPPLFCPLAVSSPVMTTSHFSSMEFDRYGCTVDEALGVREDGTIVPEEVVFDVTFHTRDLKVRPPSAAVRPTPTFTPRGRTAHLPHAGLPRFPGGPRGGGG